MCRGGRLCAATGEYLVDHGFVSCIGHKSTAQFVADRLGLDVAEVDASATRPQIKVNPGDIIFVVQLLKRLEEGQVLTLEQLQAFPVSLYMVTV
jgi:hypothetical protein